MNALLAFADRHPAVVLTADVAILWLLWRGGRAMARGLWTA